MGQHDTLGAEAIRSRLAALETDDPLGRSKPSIMSMPGYMDLFWRLSVEMVSGVLIGIVIGLYAQQYFSIYPWGLFFGFIGGVLAGVVNVLRAFYVCFAHYASRSDIDA